MRDGGNKVKKKTKFEKWDETQVQIQQSLLEE